MTIQEAIKSGKPFRRKVFAGWLEAKNDYFHIIGTVWNNNEFTVTDILADDWEVKQ